jgi:predicted nuclease of predicted toxin-antitoxin system
VTSPRLPEDLFYLDENFPYQVAEALSLVGYPITHPAAQGQLEAKDPKLIPFLARKHMVWITKDDDARSRHRKELLTNGVSVVWIRGVDRQKSRMTPKQLHLLLASKLDEIERRVRSARGSVYFLLYMNGERPTLKETADIAAVGHLGEAKRKKRVE